MSDAKTEAQRRAEARKAKILARGNQGLARLANTARGEEGSKLFDGNISRSTTPNPTDPPTDLPASPLLQPQPRRLDREKDPRLNRIRPEPAQRRSQGPSTPINRGRSYINADDDSDASGLGPEEEYKRNLDRMMSMLGQAPNAGDSNPFAAMLAQMSGMNTPGEAPLGIEGMEGAGAGEDPMMKLLQSLGNPNSSADGTSSPFPAFPGMDPNAPNPFAPGPPPRKSFMQRIWPVVHVLAMVALWAFTMFWWEPRLNGYGSRVGRQEVLGRWKGLRGADGVGLGGMIAGEGRFVALPLFWAFVSVELLLQSTRFVLIKAPPPAPSLISQFLPLLPPQLQFVITTGSRYLALGNQFWKDGCLLVFLLGVGTLLGGRGAGVPEVGVAG